MTGTVIFLLLTGVVFMVGSFFVTERLSPSELNKIAELSKDELRRIIDNALKDAEVKIEETIDAQIDASSEKVERSLEKETNEKIMAISEYSDTVMENMNKAHNEIMFLYNMLNDKHAELSNLTLELQKVSVNIRRIKEEGARGNGQESAETAQQASVKESAMEEPKAAGVSANQTAVLQQTVMTQTTVEEAEPAENHTQDILELYKQGMSKIDIARKLSVGLGEVSLVLGLYKGDKNS